MLPSSVADLEGEGGDTSKVPSSAVTVIWRFAVYMRTSRNMFSIFKVILLFGIGAIALLYYISLDWPVLIEDQSYGIVAGQGQQARYLIESQRCSDITTNCYAVYDAVDMFTGDVNRYLIMQDLQKEHETSVRLIPPAGVKSKESDSRFWQVNHTHINTQYVAVMLTAPFGVSALALSNSANVAANVLVVGLGGGSMNMFLTSHFPKMRITVVELDPVVVDLAWRWFGLDKTRKNVQIVTVDGVEYIEQAAAQKQLFDVVMIDACAKKGDLSCPADPFIQPHFMQNVKKILEPTGVVVLNVLPREDVMDVVDEVVRTYQNHFPTCAVARLLREINTVLACQLVQQVDPLTSQRLMSRRFQDAWNHFGFSQQFGVMEMSFAGIESRAGTGS